MANIMAPVGAVLASLSAWSGNNGQVQSSDSESFSEEHEERRSRSSSVELDSCVDNAFFSPSLELHTILPKICFDGLRELDVDMSRTTRTGVTTDIQGSRSQISAVSRGLGISQWLTSNVSRDHELRKPLTLDVRESRSLKSDVSPYPGGCQPSSSDASSDLAITHVGSPNLEINRLATDIATPTASVLSSPVSPGTDEEISVLFMTPVAADRSLLANAVVSPEVGSFQEADVDQSEDLISSPVEVLDDSPDVLEDPCFTQATLDSIATARLMPLIKQELKCWIQVRRHFEGLDLSPADLNRDKSKEGPYQVFLGELRLSWVWGP